MPTRDEYLAMLEAQEEAEAAAEEAAEAAEDAAEGDLVPGNRTDADTETVTLPAAQTKALTARASRTTKKTTAAKKKKKKKARKPKYTSGNTGSDGVNANAEKSVRRRKK